MSARVVCISRTVGAGGELVGRGVAQQLGLRYVDEEVVAKAAEKARMDLRAMAAVEHRQSLVRRLLEAIGHSIPDPLSYLRPSEADYRFHLTSPVSPTESGDPRAFIRAAVKEFAAEGDVLIVAHAASLALAGERDVLRVLVTASMATRVERLTGLLLGRDAEAAVRESDAERRNYLQRFYDVPEELPTHYDLVVNMDLLTPAQAVAIVVAAANG